MKKILVAALVLFATSVAVAAPPPIKSNPEVDRLVTQRMAKHLNRCARTTGPGDNYLCHSKKWDALAEDVQSYVYQISQAKGKVPQQWWNEFDERYQRSTSTHRNCKVRWGVDDATKAPLITECYVREYAYLEVMVDRLNKGTWKPEVAAATPATIDKAAQAKYMRSLKETNSNNYEGD